MTIETIYNTFLTCSAVCTDTRKITKNCMFFALKGDNFNGNTFAEAALDKGASFVIIDEKQYQKSEQYILVDDVLKTLQALATIHRKSLNIPIIALTGSNGKTTTKELINAVLSKSYITTATIGNLNNHIGVPLTLLSMTKATEIGIVEMGANHQKEIEFLTHIALPDFGLITNFGKAHLEGFGSIEGVIKGKSEMYDFLKAHHKTIFINKNDALQVKQVGNYKNTVVFGSQTQLLKAQPYISIAYKNEIITTHLTGTYNYNNVSVAIAIGEHFNVSTKAIIKAIESYIPNNNRSQIVKKNGHHIILDAYNANPTSMHAALSNFEQLNNTNKVAILGDMFELGNEAKSEHQAIANYANELQIEQVILVGENFNTTTKHDRISYFKSFEDLKSKFDTFSFKDQMILIKGSRGMALERIMELL
ncbi:UDP-N-acetylmuramoyl-tripeptide--D-alanyl-D-alanine ligase [Psychroserpens algicola]|uniref:UDP-N-acetylmuramoyl-tripeptide--D-alanyl-D-alanine ligase n=1 Tax=Psychroserpens algicola TaxID=1719034 RepID=A0ABT0H5Q4_9FLAO|nr:UDP-N-acetylmuramoyl-tripeptide--D-alanyl-D-alanine ligase [Psychroserpens algicola]MCK8479681.1 UDP-N-acetylmuramoyl-tripeptide--D-alanyl-D-alanine ligase [Psychroserpens algicola]